MTARRLAVPAAVLAVIMLACMDGRRSRAERTRRHGPSYPESWRGYRL